MRGNNSNPYPRNPAAPLVQANPSLSTLNGREFDARGPALPSPLPPTTGSQFSDKSRFSRLRPPRSKPLFQGFERPSFSRIATLTVLCLLTYPAFHILKLVAKDKSLFIVRSIVAVWCPGIGFVLGYMLLKIGAQHLEAASEFTLVSGCRDALILSYFSNSLGDRDSHEPRRRRNETPRSGQKLE